MLMSVLLDASLDLMHAGQETLLHRVRVRGQRATWLLRSPAPSCPAGLRLALLESELRLASQLHPGWAAQPISLERIGGEPCLLLRDPGAETLEHWMSRTRSLDDLLRVAVALAATTRMQHANGLLHRDLKPEHILVNGADSVWLTGFGLAETAAPRDVDDQVDVIVGTLAYMSPEQAGRLDGGVDARSDLYALGVVLYRMFAGRLPFHASDALGWIHCHVAQSPPPLGDVAALPGQVSRVILKLLEKAPEDRYQTAAALEADLRRCLNEFAGTGAITEFPPGHFDIAARLLAPVTLYGREPELESLSASWQRVREGGAELVLLAGTSGVGKSTLVREFQRRYAVDGLFASGKCDQHKQGVPYATLAQALQQLVRHVLSLPAVEAEPYRHALDAAVGANGQLMLHLIPELEALIGPQPDLVNVSPPDAQSRFERVFADLLTVFATPQRPLILCMDDLQWLDQPTLALIQHLATKCSVPQLMVIGTYRRDTIHRSHALLAVIREIYRSGASLRELAVAPLKHEDVALWLDDALSFSEADVDDMAAIVHAKTGGNPLAMTQFLGDLLQEGLLAVEAGSGEWRCDLQAIGRRPFTDNMVDAMLARLQRLPQATQNALENLACLGASASAQTLTLALDIDEPTLHANLGRALDAGLVARSGDGYAFVHDRIQEAAYAAIPPGECQRHHLRIARVIAAQAPSSGLPTSAFDLAHQYNLALPLLTDDAERDAVAAINLAAAEQAMTVMGHSSSAEYLAKGLVLLGSDAWARCYELAFPMALRLIECQVQTGDYAAAEEGLESLLRRANNLVDVAAVSRAQTDLFTMLGKFAQAVTVGRQYLRRVGFDCPQAPSVDDVHREVTRLRRLRGARTIEQIAALPAMDDPVHQATMDLLARVLPAALYTDRHLHSLLVVWMANLTLEQGYSDASCLAHIMLSRVLGPYFGDYEEGFRYARLGFDTVETRGLAQLRASAYLCYAVFCNTWRGQARSNAPLLRQALTAARAFGDVTYAAYSYNNLVANMMLTGEWLGDVERVAEEGLGFVRATRFDLGEMILRTQLNQVRALRGQSAEITLLGEDEDEEAQLRYDLEHRAGFELPLCWFWIRKLQACVIAGDHETARRAAACAEPMLWACAEFAELAEFHYYAALAIAQNDQGRDSTLQALHEHQRQLQVWVRHCPGTFDNRAALVNAEVARLEGRNADAQMFYDQAVRSARQAGFAHNEALAAEFAARFHAVLGLETVAEAYLLRARDGYQRWGAHRKVRELEVRSSSLRSTQAMSDGGASVHMAVEDLDVASIVRASHAVSGEILLEDLIGNLMQITLEQAGADRAILMLQRASELVPAARAQRVAGAVEVSTVVDTASSELPASILHVVASTRTSVLLHDARHSDDFGQDAYLCGRRPRSVLCLPLLKQGELVGVLYLENRLTAGVFSRRRVALLELLASQAAIALENARLYAELVDENNERRRVESALRDSEAILALGEQISQTGSWHWNTATDELQWSQHLRRMLEFDAIDRNPTLDDLVALTHPDDRAYTIEQRTRGKSTNGGYTYEYRMLLPSGTIKHVLVTGQPDPAEGREHFFVGTLVDVTERRLAEEALRAAQAELAQAARMITLGEVAASIAHEVNQPLTAMVANANACLRWLADEKLNPAKAREMAGYVARDGLRAGEIIRSIRAQAKDKAMSMNDFDVNEALRDIFSIVANDLKRQRIVLDTQLDPALPLLLADRVQLRQVLMNLIRNGADALGQRRGMARCIRVVSRFEQPEHIVVTVEDNGPGIEPALRERIFEPFFTTKEDGMGIGLSICRSIVSAHGGSLNMRAVKPHGSVFEMVLPTTPPLS